MPLSPRLSRELKTITAMVKIYCGDHHQGSDKNEIPCNDCQEFLDYAVKRLTYCPFREHKPSCGNCTIHCYNSEMREKAKTLMRYSGPKMLCKHPILAFMHLLDSRKPVPQIKKKGKTDTTTKSTQAKNIIN